MSDKPSSTISLIIAALMLATAMSAVEGTIVATAAPTIIGSLGNFAEYSWLFSAYLIAQSATSVIYGKLADIFGRKPVLIIGVTVLLIGSLLCGVAWSMTSLIFFRILQGLGAGAIYPVTTTIVGDLYKLHERSRAQGLLAVVWAASAVLGPLIGGLIISHFSWSWIFWINVPVGLLTVTSLWLFLPEVGEPKTRVVDYIGALLFSVSVGSFLVVLSQTDLSTHPFSTAALLIAFVATGIWFLVHERRAPEPIVSLRLWMNSLVATGNICIFFSGVAALGVTMVLPAYVQSVMGYSPAVAGLSLTAIALGYPLALMLSGRLYAALGVSKTLRAGSVLLPAGSALVEFLTPTMGPLAASFGTFLMGVGIGLITITSIGLIQDSVDWQVRGSATASFTFARSLGNTVGAAIIGALVNLQLDGRPFDVAGSLAEISAHSSSRGALGTALRSGLTGVLVASLLSCMMSYFIPMRQPHTVVTASPTVAVGHRTSKRRPIRHRQPHQ